MGNRKSRYYAFLVYPDSTSIDSVIYYLEEEAYIDYILSPLHTDNVDDGAKPHYHLILCFQNPVSESTIERIGERVSSVSKFFAITNPIGCTRYLVHADNPEKKQYSISDVRSHGLAAELLRKKAFSENELNRVAATFRSIHNYIVDNDIHDMLALQTYLLNSDFQAFMLVQQNYKYFESLCKSFFRANVYDENKLD